jgi:4-hydroxy-tetrahydrodipicolinate synthase
MTTPRLAGVYTAIVTPFTETGAVDWPALDALVEHQIEGDVDGIVPMGTTGESPTLDFEEHMQVVAAVTRRVNGRVQVVAGTGANATNEALELTRAALDLGCTATLQVTPYYNKPNDSGLRRHFEAVADLGLPVMLYNVPGRTVKALSVELIAALAEHPNIVALKEAGGSAQRVSEIRAACSLDILSGDDPLTLPMIACGAVGVVSVVSNLIPSVVADLVEAALSGHFAEALEIHDRYFPLFHTMLNLDVNPVPVKTALALQGRVQEQFRLPLAPLSPEARAKLEDLLRGFQLL